MALKRETQILFRSTYEEKQELRNLAHLLDLSMSQVIRHAVRQFAAGQVER